MDPSEMSDEELKAAINGDQPEETPTSEEPAVPPAEPAKEEPPQDPPAEEPETPAPAEAPAQDPPTEEGERPPSRREQLRVRQLLEKYGPPPEQPKDPAPSQRPDYRELINADDDAVYETLNKTADEIAKAAHDQGANETLKQLRTVEWRTNLRIDNQQVEQTYKQLNKNSDQFHPVLADALNRRYLALSGFNPKTGLVDNPDVSYAEFVESEFELADEIANTRVAQSTENIAKQAAQTGLRPSGGAAKTLDLTKAPEDMTNEELEAVIGASVARDRRGRFTKRT